MPFLEGRKSFLNVDICRKVWWQCGPFSFEKEVLTQMEGPHVSELSADNLREGESDL